MQETQETWVQSLSQEDPLEEEMATHSGILAWKIPWTEEPGGLQSMGSQRVRHNGVTEHALTLTYLTVSRGNIYKMSNSVRIWFVLSLLQNKRTRQLIYRQLIYRIKKKFF